MKIQTMSLVVGTKACNASCQFCVSKQTGFDELPRTTEINYHNLNKAIRLAEMSGVTTVLLTGKGEPTLYPRQIANYLKHINGRFPFVELQTNGLSLGCPEKESIWVTDARLRKWWQAGLSTIALSTVGVDYGDNMRVYDPGGKYMDLPRTVGRLHEQGFSVRLCVMMKRGAVDSPRGLEEVIHWCKEYGVEQLTFRPIRGAARSADNAARSYVKDHELAPGQCHDLRNYIADVGTPLLSLAHGAEVFDVDGQNVCMSDCLTRSTDPNQMRQIIFYADGRLTYDWQCRGAVLLGGRTSP